MSHEPAAEPEDLDRFFIERANAGDVDGLVALYEPDAVVARSDGSVTVGHDAIRAHYAELVTRGIVFGGEVRPAIRNGNLALTGSFRPGNATIEIARRQADGSWLWILDQPSVLPPGAP